MVVLSRAPEAEDTQRRTPINPRRSAHWRQPGGYDAARRQALAAYVFIAPAMLIFLVFTLLPVACAAYLSFTNYDVFTRMDWIGVANYADVFEDELFWRAFWNTSTYTVWSIPLSMAIGLALAILLNQKLRGLGFYRTVYYVPVVTSMVAVAMIWIQLFDPL
jgi:multiple sugar transport system permease protein